MDPLAGQDVEDLITCLKLTFAGQAPQLSISTRPDDIIASALRVLTRHGCIVRMLAVSTQTDGARYFPWVDVL